MFKILKCPENRGQAQDPWKKIMIFRKLFIKRVLSFYVNKCFEEFEKKILLKLFNKRIRIMDLNVFKKIPRYHKKS